MSASALPIRQGFALPEEYAACLEALKDTQTRLAYMDSQYKRLNEQLEAVLATNRALKAEKKMLLDRITELSAMLQRYEPTARLEAYPRWQNLSAEDRAAFTHAVGANHVRGAMQGPRSSAPSPVELQRTQRESASRRAGEGHVPAKLPPVQREERRPPEPERAPKAGPAPKPVVLPPATADAEAGDTSHPQQVIRIDEHRAPLPPPSASPTAGMGGKRKFVHVDPTLPPPKRNRDATHAHAPQTPVWAVPPMQTHTAPPLPAAAQRPAREAMSPPVGPYGRAPPLPTYSAERSSASGTMDGNGDTTDTSPRRSAARGSSPGVGQDAGAPVRT